MHTLDAIVIGSGQAGPDLALQLARAGRSVALIDTDHDASRGMPCGCLPWRVLASSARAAHVARHAADFGVVVGGEVRVDLRAVMARKDLAMQQCAARLGGQLQAMPGLQRLQGAVRFTGPRSVAVAGATLAAKQVFINVGCRPLLPDWPGLHRVPVLTQDELLGLPTLPAHLLVAGGGSSGLEFAQLYRRFGSRVTVLEAAPRLLPQEDPEVSAELQASLEREGVRVLLGVRRARAQPSAAGMQVACEAGGTEHRVGGSHLLAAVGWRPNTDALGLPQAGIATDAQGYITVDERLQTSVPGVWALGDVNGCGAHPHTAYNDFEIVAANLLRGGQRSVRDRIPAHALFTDPPLGRVGMNEAQVRATGRPALVGAMPVHGTGAAGNAAEAQGFMKVLVDAQTERFLGAALLCADGAEIVHALVEAMAAGVSYRAVQRAVHIHPTLSGLLPALLGRLVPLR